MLMGIYNPGMFMAPGGQTKKIIILRKYHTFLFGSKMETIQSWMPNNILLIGPNCVFRGA